LIVDRFSDPSQVLFVAVGDGDGDDFRHLIRMQLAYPLLKFS
jgi:hypothetical protein